MRAIGAACILVLAMVGCNGAARTRSGPDASPDASTPATPARSKSACYDLEQAAYAAAAPTLDNNQACKVASDCTTMRFGNSCFEGCERLVAANGIAAVKAALVGIDGTQCRTYHAGGCVLIPPPCAPRPPAPFVCNNGTCGYALPGASGT